MQLPQGVKDRIQETVEKIQEEGNPFAEELKVMYWFHMYAHEQVLKMGGVEVGYTFRQKETHCLMIYKALFGDTQRVVFTTATDPTQCMLSFCRRVFSERLEWKKDKYS